MTSTFKAAIHQRMAPLSCRLAQSMLLFVAICGWATGAIAGPGSEPERLILYLNEDNARVSIALQKLRQAIDMHPGMRQHSVRIKHVVVDGIGGEGTRGPIRAALASMPSAIIAPSGVLALSARQESLSIPVIFGSFQDPVGYGIVESLHKPGGNSTGISLYQPIEAKRLELLKELVPGVKRLGLIVDRWWDREPASRDFERIAREQFGIETRVFRVESTETLLAAIRSPQARLVDAWFVRAAISFEEPELVVRNLNATGLPAIYGLGMLTAKGGLISYQPVMEDHAATMAAMLGLILDGISPGDIPVERPKLFELAINLDTARQLGIAIPKSLLKRATTIYP